MKNKKSLAFISAIMILIFHLWVPIFNNGLASDIEKYLKFICYIGVDIFFFISAYSIGGKNIKYGEFIKNRFVNVYLKFIVFLLIAAFYNDFDFTKLISILTGYELLIKGGGSFLWFIPAIMILYLIMPLYKEIDNKYKIVTPCVLFIIWFLFSSIISYYTQYKAIFIFTNRLPIFMIGYYSSKYKLFDILDKKKIIYYIISIVLFILGSLLSYYGYNTHIKLNLLYDFHFLINIPLILGTILLINKIPHSKLLDKFGKLSLEVYAVQMIFGFKLVNNLLNTTDNALLTNMLVFIIIFVFSYIFSILYNKIFNKKISYTV